MSENPTYSGIPIPQYHNGKNGKNDNFVFASIYRERKKLRLSASLPVISSDFPHFGL